jgi:hypothetical protein
MCEKMNKYLYTSTTNGTYRPKNYIYIFIFEFSRELGGNTEIEFLIAITI